MAQLKLISMIVSLLKNFHLLQNMVEFSDMLKAAKISLSHNLH
jgi:hypothetical protein